MMKINYTTKAGKRTTMTLNEALFDTWLMAKPELRDGNLSFALLEIREMIEGLSSFGKRDEGQTFTSLVETEMLAEIRDYIRDLEIKEFKLERERDGQ